MNKRVSQVRAAIALLACWMLIGVAFFVPLLDSTRPPYLDLSGAAAQWAYWLSWSAGKQGAGWLAAGMLLLLLAAQRISFQTKIRQFFIMVLVIACCAGAGSALNEHLLKPALQVSRPNIISLAGEQGTGPLGMTADAFYALGNKTERSHYLQQVLSRKPIPMQDLIAAHWIAETGYSMPSGHSFAALFFATFFLMLAVSHLSGRPVIVFYWSQAASQNYAL
ncbi:MAG: hypothetical protein KZQ58_10965 [gamma proteobacterium symbiont of Bathyaustriella thionipta]|nr:hypothetical protein [gamma proteobacterium symbiont of Bathyaustriella thionipta]